MALWVPNSVGVLRYRATTRTVTLPTGERAKVTTDDSGTVRHIEHGDVLDAIVRPKTIRLTRSVKDPFVRRLIADAQRKDCHGSGS